MAKTVRKVFGSLTGEGTVYQTLNELMFVVKEPIRNPKVVKDLTQMYIANPEVLPEVIQVFPVDAKTKKPVDYYSADTVQPGHKFMISGPNDAIVFKALGAYNKSVGALTNKLKYIRFEVLINQLIPLVIKEINTSAYFLVRSKADADLSVLNLWVGKEVLSHSHYLCYAGFIICPKKCGSVCADNGLPLKL